MAASLLVCQNRRFDCDCSSCRYPDVPQVSFNYAWNINNFSLVIENGENIIKSAHFSGNDSSNGRKWCLHLHLNGVDASKGGRFMSLFLVLIVGPPVAAKYTFSIVDKEGRKEIVWHSNVFEIFKENDGLKAHGCDILLERDIMLLQKLYPMPDDCLTILCDIAIVNKCHYCGTSWNENPVELGELLLRNSEHTDVILRVEDKELHAHKAVLSARSPVFAAMFRIEMKESKTNVVEIEDLSYEAAVQMLRFIYTGKVQNLSIMGRERDTSSQAAGPTDGVETGMGMELLIAANKYQLGDLVGLCEEAISDSLTIETAADAFILADQHNAKLLKRKTIEFIERNRNEVKKTEGWKTLTRRHANILLEAFF